MHGLAMAILSVRVSLCLPVRPSIACIVTNRNNRLSVYQHHTTEQYLSFLEAKINLTVRV